MRLPGGLRAVLDVRREERGFAALMFAVFFLIISTFWILKPLKKALFIQFYEGRRFEALAWSLSGPQAELLAKVANMFVALAAVAAFTLLARRFRRASLVVVLLAFVGALQVVYAFAIARPDAWTVWTFYLFGDLYSTLLVAGFFAFLNDSVVPEAARRLYGPVGLGGVAGGVFGTTVLRSLIDRVERPEWMWITLGLGALTAAAAWAAGRRVPAAEARRTSGDAPSREAEAAKRPGRGSAALEGARLVARSPYLLAIVAIVGLYEIVSTVMDFQFTATVDHYLQGAAVGRHFATVYLITNSVSLAVQIFVTPYVLTRFGVGVALLVLPAAAALGSSAFLVVPLLWVGSALNTLDNAFNYSINQSSKEALYVPTTPDEKYKAKAFIDMFAMRSAKALAVGVSLGMGAFFGTFESVRWLSLFTLGVVVVWLYAVRYAGRRFRALADD